MGGALVYWTGWLWLDPAISFVILGIVAYGSWGLLRETLQLSLQAVPNNIDLKAVQHFLLAQPGVQQVHHLHVWPLSTQETALTVHLVRPGYPHDNAFLHRLQAELQQQFTIGHATIQIEEASPTLCASDACEVPSASH